MEGLLIALLIELGIRFGPEAIFFAADFPLVLPLQFKDDADEKSKSLPSISLPAVPAVAEPAPAAQVATVIEADEDKPAPLAPPPPKRTVSKRKPERKATEPQCCNVLPFRKACTL